MAQTAILGPWSGGLNLTSNRDLSVFLQPNELGEAVNVVFSPEGFVQPRPGCKMLLHYAVPTSANIYDHYDPLKDCEYTILGNVLSTEGLGVVLQLRVDNQAYLYTIFSPTTVYLYWTPPAGTWFTHLINFNSGIEGHTGLMFFAPFANKSYVASSYSTSITPTKIPDANMIPASDGGMIVKNRLFLWHYETSKFMWSPALYILDWTGLPVDGKNGTDVSQTELIEPHAKADGITTVQFVNNNFYIFKKNKTFMFTYQIQPVDDGYLRKIQNELGAFASTMYRNQIVIVNNRGVFRIDVTEFVDLQVKLNLRFETPLDRFYPENVFITDFNNDLLVGFTGAFEGESEDYFYYMNGYNGAWSRWTFDYNRQDEGSVKIAHPGSRQYRSQLGNDINQVMYFTTFDKQRVTYMDWKPRYESFETPYIPNGYYHIDTNMEDTEAYNRGYLPSVGVKTKSVVGNSNLNFKKVYRVYIRFYLSDEQVELSDGDIEENAIDPNDGIWTISVNYDDYRFGVDTSHGTEQLLYLYPSDPDLPILPALTYPVNPDRSNTVVFTRTYQLPIHQFRALEFVFELKRKYTTTTDLYITNPDIDDPPKPLKKDYYFLLSNILFDFEDKARM